jgi:hypothetical protein
MKKNKFLKLISVVFFLVPLHLFAQQQEQDITGLWKGSLYDDTTQQYIPYEIAVSNDNGKLTGYSYASFKGDKGDEIGIKTIKLKRQKDKIIIEDVDLIDNSYSMVPPKNVRKLIILTITVKDSILIMSGKWRTNWTKQYHPVTGTIEIQRKNDLWKQEPLMKKLDSMKLSNTLSFNPPEKKEEPVALVKPKEKIAPKKTTEVAAAEKPQKKVKKAAPVVTASDDSTKVVAVAKPVKKEKKSESAVVAKEKKTEKKKTEPVIIPAAAEAAKRTTQVIQSIFYKTDSLVFTLYDNGVVDGDTVSILMDKDLIFSKQGLSEKPVSKTVYTKDAPDSILLTLYAENLGSIPPNTGLLIIYDGKKRYEVFFSADLQTNAAIVLRRKKEDN